MPDMMDRDREVIRELSNQISGLARGTIVGNHQFKAVIILVGKPAEGGREGVRPVVGGQDDGDGGGHDHFAIANGWVLVSYGPGWIT